MVALTTLVRLLALPAVLVVCWFCSAQAGATQLITQGFLTSSSIAPGSIVSLKKDSTENVEASNTDNSNNILGVVIDGGNPAVTLSTGQSNQVQVATNGLEQVLVSNINGNITAGDSVTASPIAGVGMKATANAKTVGVAQDNFPNSTTAQQSYTDKAGKKHNVELGEVLLLVNVAYFYKQPEKSIIPTAIQNLANALAGKTVNPLPILISIGIFLVTLVVVVSIIYAMIRSSIISVGRNPMSQAAVYRNVIQLSALVVVILMVAVAAIYLLLTRF